MDWPISYDDLAPYYDRTEKLIGVYGTNAGLENHPDSSPGILHTPPKPRVTELMIKAGANALGKVSYGTEAGLFQAEDIPTVICGPGSMEQGHKPNEFVSLEQVRACEAFMRRLMDHLAH